MSRLLAPQVADMIRAKGKRRSMSDAKQEMSVVFCDFVGLPIGLPNTTPAGQDIRCKRTIANAK